MTTWLLCCMVLWLIDLDVGYSSLSSVNVVVGRKLWRMEVGVGVFIPAKRGQFRISIHFLKVTTMTMRFNCVPTYLDEFGKSQRCFPCTDCIRYALLKARVRVPLLSPPR